MGLTRMALTRPIFILMLMVLAVLMGTISYNGMRKELQPDASFGVIVITSVYPGAGPEEINTLVSRKIEEAVSGIEGQREVTSSSQEGFSTVVASFEIGTNMDEALNDVRAKVDQVLNELPPAVEKPTIAKFDTTSDPVYRLALRSDTLDSQQLRDLADDKFKDRFSRVPGVASVAVSGGEVREIRVAIKKDKLLAYGVGINQVVRAIQSNSLNVPSGRLVSGEQEFSVRVLGEFRSIEEIRNSTLSLSDPNVMGGKKTVVRLKDVAEITDGVTERRTWSRLNGSDAVIMSVQKARGAGAIDVVAGVENVAKKLESEFDVTFEATYNQAEQISESLFDLNFALFFGIALVGIIVYVFLHNLRGTIIVATAIPVCLLGTFVVLNALGFTINFMSMLALSLAIGVLVDDAIVVLENIYRHLRMGEEPFHAALNGRSEIGLAAIAITLADVVVFIPIAFMGGVVGQFFKPLGVGFAVATLLSLFVSFTVTPMLASRWYRKGEDVEHPTGRFAQTFEKRFENLQRAYRRTLAWALLHRWFVFISGFVVLIGVFMMIGGSFAPSAAEAISSTIPMVIAAVGLGVVVFLINLARRALTPKVILNALLFGLVFPLFALLGFAYGSWKGEPIFKFAFFPPTDAGSVSVNVALAPGSSLEMTSKVLERIEEVVSAHPDVKYVQTDIGSRGQESGTNYGRVVATLHDRKALLDSLGFAHSEGETLRVRADTAVQADILEALGKVPGAEITVGSGDAQGFGAPIQMSFASEDRELLLATVTKIKEGLALGKVKGVISPDISTKPGKPEVRAIPDRVRLADMGLTAADVANTMRVLYEGNTDTKYRVLGKEYDIRVMMDLEDRNDPRIVEQLPITFVQGRPVFLGTVAQIEQGVGVDKIERRDREEEIRLTANLLPGFAAGSVQSVIDQWIQKENMVPEGVRIKPLGQADFQARESGYIFGALGIAFVLVYMLLASLYDNLLYPFIIQLAQPQAMVGALLALILTDKTLNIVGMVGIITLVGLVGKNAILLVDYTNTLRRRGFARDEAIMESGPTRLRPIMMTTLALILGMLPVALAIGRGSEFRETIGITIIGGIALSTLLTLVVIPCSYTIFDDFSNWLGSIGRNRLGIRPPDKPKEFSVEGEDDPESQAGAEVGVD